MKSMGCSEGGNAVSAPSAEVCAIAGALAGGAVTVVLHPLDTLKVLIQATRSGVRSGLPMAATLSLRQKGVLGSFYAGLLPSLAASAPISAIYTFTYELCKQKLQPIAPPEHLWAVQCVSGACASVATSVVFTPTERIKAQLQIGAYSSTPQAVAGILRSGGVSSLFRGWGAVLCRNIPQSVVKFMVYEQLMAWSRESTSPNFSPSFGSGAAVDQGSEVRHSMVCGAAAASIAACVTNPVDVVKTRIQTGGTHAGVRDTLAAIIREESVFGLYRGLIPRLGIYMMQGAIFFTAYDVLKRALNNTEPQDQKRQRSQRSRQQQADDARAPVCTIAET